MDDFALGLLIGGILGWFGMGLAWASVSLRIVNKKSGRK